MRFILALGLAAAVLAIPTQNSCVKVAPEPVNAVLSESNFDFDAVPQSAKRAAWTLAPREETAPLVTVVSRASDSGLQALAANLEAQTLQAFQWVIVNDASADLSGFRASVVECDGCTKASALNAAAAEVATPYVVFVQEGDLLEDAFLERLVWVLETNQEFHYANTFSADVAKRSLDTSTFYDNALETNMASTALVRTTALKSLPAFPQVFNEVAAAKSFFLSLKDASMHGVTVPEFLRWSTVEVEDDDFDAAAAFPALAQSGHVNPLLAACDDCKTPEIAGAFKSTCDKSILVVLPWMSHADTDSLEMVKSLTKKGWQVTVATTLAAAEGDALMPELLQHTQDVHVLPHFVRTEDYGHYLLHLVKSRGAAAVVVSHSYAGYNFLPFLRAKAPTVALVDMVHAKEALWRPLAFFEDAEDAQGGGYARLSALFSQYLDASVYAKAEDKDWTAAEQEAIAQKDTTATTFYSPTSAYASPARGMDLDSAIEGAIAKAQAAVTSEEATNAAEAQIELVAGAIQDNDGSMGSFVHRQNGNRYDMMFLESWDNEGRRSGAGSGSGSGSGTPSPTTTPTIANEVSITMTTTLNGVTVAQFAAASIQLVFRTKVAAACTTTSNTVTSDDVSITSYSRRSMDARRSSSDVSVVFSVNTGSSDSTASTVTDMATALDTYMADTTSSGFASEFNADSTVAAAGISTTGVTVTSSATVVTAAPTPAPTSADVAAAGTNANFAVACAAVLLGALTRVW